MMPTLSSMVAPEINKTTNNRRHQWRQFVVSIMVNLDFKCRILQPNSMHSIFQSFPRCRCCYQPVGPHKPPPQSQQHPPHPVVNPVGRLWPTRTRDRPSVRASMGHRGSPCLTPGWGSLSPSTARLMPLKGTCHLGPTRQRSTHHW